MRIRNLALGLIFLPLFANAAEAPKTQLQPELNLTVGKYSETVNSETYSQWVMPKSSLAINDRYLSEIENISTCPQGERIYCDLVFSAKDRMHTRLNVSYAVNNQAIEKYLQDLAAKSDSEPVNAAFSFEDGKTAAFTAEQDGTKLNIEKSTPLIAELFSNSSTLAENKKLELPYDVTKPSISASEINNLGINTLIGEGRSNFRGSTSSRIHNIKTAVKKFNGALIKPGEEFSFVGTLGEVDDKSGYLPELVIKKNRTEPEFGGGVCQVSTTVFRAAIYSGLKITARRNHAYPVSYYNPQGMDSTIYVPRPDLKFINNTPGHILIQSKIIGTELIFDFYGTNDGRIVAVDGPKITESNPDRSIKTVFTQTVTDKDGKEIINDVFKSSYDSPYKYPHPGDQMLAAKPSNWTDEEWDQYKQAYREANPTTTTKKR
jgi:vancomycin resistance protein YoaR